MRNRQRQHRTAGDPPGREHLAVADKIGEGYGLCDTGGIEYFDYAGFGDSGNWNPATVVSQDATSVKIARTTGDGIWTLTQTITQVAGTSPSAKIAMTIRNNDPAGQRDVVIFRYANVNADSFFQNNFDATRDSAFGWNSTDGRDSHPLGFGLMLQNVGATPFHHFAFILNVPDPPEPCNAFRHAVVGPIINTDGSFFLDYANRTWRGSIENRDGRLQRYVSAQPTVHRPRKRPDSAK